MIGVVVPAFRQPILLFDAIGSIVASDDVAVVIVDDGCPQIETHLAGLGLSRLLPRTHYLRTANRGLSGARNAGIDFLLRHVPDVDAFYFLDADNMLSPWSIAEMRRVLSEHPDHDWFYPNIEMFGLEWAGDYAGAFSPLVESLMNICEAGSLVRRRVFESGLRFSEQLKAGFEDWDFWLSAIEKGYRGLHFPGSGFRYRKRPESMLAEATRKADAIRGQLQVRHPWMADIRWAVAAEHATAPRYAILLADVQRVRLTSSPDTFDVELPWSEYASLFWAALRSPKTHHAGAFLIVTTLFAEKVLAGAGLQFWALLDLEMTLRDSNIAMLSLTVDEDDQIVIGGRAEGAASGASALAVSMQLLRELATDRFDYWIASLLTDAPQPRISSRHVRVPSGLRYQDPAGDVRRPLVAACRALRLHPAAAGPWTVPDCSRGSPDRAAIHLMLRAKFGGGILPPHQPSPGPSIAFVLPHVAFGGVEKVAMFVARALRRRNYSVTLVVAKASSVEYRPAMADAFDHIVFLDNPQFEDWTGPSYLGTALSRWSVADQNGDELNILSVFDVVIACHAGDVMGLFGQLQRRGVVTAAYVHLLERLPVGRDVGHAFIALAYEFALDFVIGCSQDLVSQMLARGVPGEKLVMVPNAAGIDIDDERAGAIAARRGSRQDSRLNVLFVGRLDEQKGLDRLADVATMLAGEVRLRIIGRSVIGKADLPGALRDLVEPPVFDDDLAEVYAWADVLILPSRYEGLPLSVIEAMAFGVVPVVASCGALAEIIEPGRTGEIVEQDDCAAAMVEHIRALAADRQRLAVMAVSASAAARVRSWEAAVDGLDTALRQAIERKADRRGLQAPPPAEVRPAAASRAAAE